MRLRVVLLAAATVSVLAGCSGDDDPLRANPTGQVSASSVRSTTPPVSSGASGSAEPTAAASGERDADVAADVLTWTDQFCGALGEFAGIAELAPPDMGSGDAASAKKALSDYFGRLERALGSSLDGMRKLPPAPLPAAERASKSLTDALGPARRQAAETKRKIDAAAPGNQQALVGAMRSLQGIGTAMGKLENPMRALEGSPKLAAAARRAPNCQKLAG
ncbi:hypothetical protein B0I33_102668 [Prauserella shujinwangii]|uniref:Uncharacterized protein n=1 Tax=Prauserella shujinwangii TaxID=1453103 RepID=A0A2T0M1R3_9PSEU|nr:hypothetical protein [Prauserella shujinwangii]PRX50544.1 hypothetical protein B0I33_102668 [Prauserella shujinwangii]